VDVGYPALKSLLTYGRGLNGDVALDIAWLVFFTAILFVIGVTICPRARLKLSSKVGPRPDCSVTLAEAGLAC
jgi:hypothetical protein